MTYRKTTETSDFKEVLWYCRSVSQVKNVSNIPSVSTYLLGTLCIRCIQYANDHIKKSSLTFSHSRMYLEKQGLKYIVNLITVEKKMYPWSYTLLDNILINLNKFFDISRDTTALRLDRASDRVQENVNDGNWQVHYNAVVGLHNCSQNFCEWQLIIINSILSGRQLVLIFRSTRIIQNWRELLVIIGINMNTKLVHHTGKTTSHDYFFHPSLNIIL